MVRRKFLPMRKVYACLTILCVFILSPRAAFSSEKKTDSEILAIIYNEVKELGPYENENFLRREFHMDLDNNAVNKEEYVMVLSQKIDSTLKMVLEITYFEPDKDNRFVKNAKETKQIKCEMVGEAFQIKTCDYEAKKINRLLSRILAGVKEKKQLLKLVKK